MPIRPPGGRAQTCSWGPGRRVWRELSALAALILLNVLVAVPAGAAAPPADSQLSAAGPQDVKGNGEPKSVGGNGGNGGSGGGNNDPNGVGGGVPPGHVDGPPPGQGVGGSPGQGLGKPPGHGGGSGGSEGSGGGSGTPQAGSGTPAQGSPVAPGGTPGNGATAGSPADGPPAPTSPPRSDSVGTLSGSSGDAAPKARRRPGTLAQRRDSGPAPQTGADTRAGHRKAAPSPARTSSPSEHPLTRRAGEQGADAGIVRDAAEVAGEVAPRAAFPLLLLLILLAFLGIQDRIDRRDPKLALAPISDEPYLSFGPPMASDPR